MASDQVVRGMFQPDGKVGLCNVIYFAYLERDAVPLAKVGDFLADKREEGCQAECRRQEADGLVPLGNECSGTAARFDQLQGFKAVNHLDGRKMGYLETLPNSFYSKKGIPWIPPPRRNLLLERIDGFLVLEHAV